MATYTTQVRTICSQIWTNLYPNQSLPDIDKIIEDVATVVMPLRVPQGSWLTNQNVSQAVLKHYWMREIGLETYGLWKYHITTKLNEILPKYVEIAAAQADMGSIWESSNKKEQWKVGKTTITSEDTSNTRDTSGKQTSSNVRDSDNTKTGSNTRDLTGKEDTTRNSTENATTTGKVTESFSQEDERNISSTNAKNISGSNSNSGTTSGQNLISDTPQNGLTDVINGKYLSRAEITSGTNHSEGTNEGEENGQENTSDNLTSSGENEQNTTGSTDVTGTVTEGKTESSKITDTYNEDNVGKITDTGSGDHTEKITDAGTRTGNLSGDEEGSRSYTEFNGNKPELIFQYNEMYISVMQMIIGEVADMFIGIIG